MTIKEIIEKVKYRFSVPNSGLFQAIFRKILYIGVGLSVQSAAGLALGENYLYSWIITLCKFGLNTSVVTGIVSYFFYRISTPYTPNTDKNPTQ